MQAAVGTRVPLVQQGVLRERTLHHLVGPSRSVRRVVDENILGKGNLTQEARQHKRHSRTARSFLKLRAQRNRAARQMRTGDPKRESEATAVHSSGD